MAPQWSVWLDCSDGTGYVFVTERALRAQGFTVNLTLLAVPTSTIGADFQQLGNQYGHLVLANEIDESLFVTKEATTVTVFAGGNDIEVVMSALGGGAGASNQAAYIDSQIQAFAADYNTLLANVRGRSLVRACRGDQPAQLRRHSDARGRSAAEPAGSSAPVGWHDDGRSTN